MVEVGGLHLVFPSPRKAQHLARQLGAVHDPFFDVLQIGHVAVVRCLVEQHQGDIALDPHQQVVEVVGNTAGECPDGLHFLGLLRLDRPALELFFRQELIGEVGHESDDGRRAVDLRRDGGDVAVDRGAVRAGERDSLDRRLFAPGHGLEKLPDRRQRLGRVPVIRGQADELFPTVAEHPAGGRVGVEKTPFAVGDGDPHRGDVEDGAETVLAVWLSMGGLNPIFS